MSNYAGKVHGAGADKFGFEDGGAIGLLDTDGETIIGRCPIGVVDTVTAAEETAGAIVVVTGLTTVTGWILQVLRAGVDVTADAAVTESGGSITVADGGSTYAVTEDDIINLLVW